MVNETPLTLSDLPEEVIRLILAHLPLIDKIKCETVCHLWKNVIFDMQYKLRFTKCKRFYNYCSDPLHGMTPNDWIPQLICNSQKCHQSPINFPVLECVLKKCGKSLIAINLDAALINEKIFETIVFYCPNIQCLSLSSSTGINDECLEIIASNYSKQLRHLNLECGANRRLYFSTSGLNKLLEMCPNIQVFHVASIRSQFSYRLKGHHLNLLKNVTSLSAHLPDVPIEELITYAENHGSKLIKLNIDGIIYNESIINDLIIVISMFSNLKSLSLLTRMDIPLDMQIVTLSKALPGLRSLRIRFNSITITTIEAISYFSNLRTLEIGLWKPFEDGLTSLSLQSLQYCSKLVNLEIHNFVDGDSLFMGINDNCPNLEMILLNNVFGCTDETLHWLAKCRNIRVLRVIGNHIWAYDMAPEITESGITEMVALCQHLNLIEIPCTFNIPSDGILVSALIAAAKRRPFDRITFIYGKMSSSIIIRDPDICDNLRIIRKRDI